MIYGWLHGDWNLIGYVTFRAFAGAMTAFVLSLLLGRGMIRRLKRLKIGEVVRTEATVARLGHGRKAGTPTMGGLLIVFTTTMAAAAWCDLNNAKTWLVWSVMAAMSCVGALDDGLKLASGKSGGLTMGQKLALQLPIALAAFWAVCAIPETGGLARMLYVPFLKQPVVVDMPVMVAAGFACLVLVGTANAVNLADGLDGLAVGCTMPVAGTYLAMAYAAGHAVFAKYLLIPVVPGAGEIAVFSGCLLGGCLGFLWWNGYPAKVFMGNTGSLALGGAIGMTAILLKQELTLLITGGVFVAEALSVLIQTGTCLVYHLHTGKVLAQGKRPFRMTPLHHHFELMAKERARVEGRGEDSAENSVIVRFWIAGVVAALLGLATLKLR